jgi:hypothetical protein
VSKIEMVSRTEPGDIKGPVLDIVIFPHLIVLAFSDANAAGGSDASKSSSV